MLEVKQRRILIVEDEPAAATLLSKAFGDLGFSCEVLNDGQDVLNVIRAGKFSLVLLDLGLPETDGLLICREIRALGEIGIIITTAQQDPIERIVALETGADAFFSKPLPMRELQACSKNLIRRYLNYLESQKQNTQAHNPCYQVERAKYQPESACLSLADKQITLPQSENDLFLTLVENAGIIVSRDQLMQTLGNRTWQPNDRTIDTLVSRLRNKLKGLGLPQNLIKSQYGRGYLLNTKPELCDQD